MKRAKTTGLAMFAAFTAAMLIGTITVSAAPETKTWEYEIEKTAKTEKPVEIEVTLDGYVGGLEIELPVAFDSNGLWVENWDSDIDSEELISKNLKYSFSVSIIDTADYDNASFEGKPYGPLSVRVANDPDIEFMTAEKYSICYDSEKKFFYYSNKDPMSNPGVPGDHAYTFYGYARDEIFSGTGPFDYKNFYITNHVSLLKAWYTGTPSDDFRNTDDWDQSVFNWFAIFLTQRDADAFLATGKMDGYDWPGLKELLIENGANSQTPVAKPTAATILVDGEKVAFDAYNIGGNNYFKLRDLAYALNGTDKQFSVSYDVASKEIKVTGNEAYTVVGGEMEGKETGDKMPVPANMRIENKNYTNTGGYTNSWYPVLQTYNIDGNNYVKLRDIARLISFGVTWDAANNTIVIDTSSSFDFDD